jgi:hypothetical protein
MRGGIWIVGLAVVLMGSCLPALAQDKEQRVAKSHWPFAARSEEQGSYESVSAREPEAKLRNAFIDQAVRDTLVYCLQGFRCGDSCASLMILNISDPANPKFVSRLRFHGGAESGYELKSYGDYVYVMVTAPDEQFIFYVIDVSDPTLPSIVGSYPLSTYASCFDVVDSLAFVTHGSPNSGDIVNAVHILNVSVPSQMSLVSKIPTEYGLGHIRVNGDHAFAPAMLDMYALDIANVAEGRVISHLSTGYDPIRLDVQKGDSLVYVADADIMWPDYWSAFTVINVADPENLQLMGQYSIFGAVLDVKAQGHWGFLSNGSCGLRIFNVSDPTTPEGVATYDIPEFAGLITIWDSLLVLPDIGPFVFDMEGLSCYPPVIGPGDPQPGDLLILSIADPANPRLLGFYSPTEQDPTGVDNVEPELLPTTFSLYQNYPNPFNPGTMIEFDLPTRGEVQLTVYNLLGQEVTRLVQSRSAGHHTIQLNMKDQASGVYFYELRAGDYSGTGKMLLLK